MSEEQYYRKMSDLWERLPQGGTGHCPKCAATEDHAEFIWSSLGMAVKMIWKCNCGRWWATWR